VLRVNRVRYARRVKRVLLVEEGWHSTLYLARALADAGCAVTVLTANGTRAACTHGRVAWRSGPALGSPGFIAAVERLARDVDHVLPLTEAAMAALWAAGAPRVFPHTEPWQRRLVCDKHALVAHVAARGISTPSSVSIGSDTTGDALVRALGLPIVIKGATGSGGRRVRIAETRAELAELLARARALDDAWIAQEHVDGPTYLVGGVFDRGRPIRIYAAEKLEQHPPRVGGAIRLRSTADVALVETGIAAIRELAWTGFASADLMRRRDGSYVLLEINPRLWGSLAGALSAGVDLFAPFAALLDGGAPEPDLGFAAGATCMIFPRYLNAAAHRNAAGLARAFIDLFGEQGRDWRDPRFVMHTLRRLRRLKRLAAPL
jgi:ATP-grasp domain